jgi:hypothetical protein
MRKRLIAASRPSRSEPDRNWLDLEKVASVEVTSEADGYPVEGALVNEGQPGWRAGAPGPQSIRLLFDHPLTILVVRVAFKEMESPRTQEFVLRWLPHGTETWKDVVRQQWNFSSPDTVEECEEYKLELVSATALELSIIPDISHGSSRASLEKFQLSGR